MEAAVEHLDAVAQKRELLGGVVNVAFDDCSCPFEFFVLWATPCSQEGGPPADESLR